MMLEEDTVVAPSKLMWMVDMPNWVHFVVVQSRDSWAGTANKEYSGSLILVEEAQKPRNWMRLGDMNMRRLVEQRSWAVIEWFLEDGVLVIWGCVEELRRKAASVMKTKDDVTNPRGIAVAEGAVHEKTMCPCTGSWGGRMGSWDPGCRVGQSRKFVAADPRVR
jgi:hypothetical protein